MPTEILEAPPVLALIKTARSIQLSPLPLVKQDAKSLVMSGAEAARDEVVFACENIEVVTGPASQQAAADALAAANLFLAKVEEQRKAAKEPFDAMGKAIQEASRAITGPVSAEADRLNKLLKGYALAERNKQLEVERARNAELQRISREEERVRLEAERAVRRAEQAVLNAKTAEAAQVAQEAVDTAKLTEQVAVQALNTQAEQALTVVEVKAPANLKSNPVWKFEVVDLDALYKARPDLCTVTPETAKINRAIRQDKCREIGGLRIFEDMNIGTK